MICSAAPVLLAEPNFARSRYSGAPGDNTCLQCHTGTALNSSNGSVTIRLPGAAVYSPGVAQRIQVVVADSTASRWGYELSARLMSDLTNGQAGSLSTPDANSRILCDGNRTAPCSSPTVVQFATQTSAGTRNGTRTSVTYEIDWMPPATDAGAVRIYAVGMGANGNGGTSGDHIYTTFVELAPASARPVISSAGVVNGASFQPGIAPQTWVTIGGTNLAQSTRLWNGSDFNGTTLPTVLDGVSVTVNGQPAAVQYVSPTQVNVLTPNDSATGAVSVVVTVDGVASEAAVAMLQPVSPAFFTFDGTYAAATHADNSLVGKVGLYSTTTPARAGETIILFGTGFGPTSPAVPSGQATAAVSPLVTLPSITIGGLPATVSFAGLVPPYAGLFQLNVQVPASLAAGDHAVVAQVGGYSSPTGVLLTVQ